MSHHVVIGGGPAGINAIETIRQLDASAAITLISDERAYARMALPYFLAKEISQQQLDTGSDEYFDRMRVARRVGRHAVRIDSGARAVHLDDGEQIGFDTLLIATGSSPVRPPIPGADGKHVHNLWTLAHALAVMESGKAKRSSAVLVGGGFIGVIILNALHKLGWKLSLVEVEGHVLPRMLDRRGAEAVEAWLRERDVDVYTGCSVSALLTAIVMSVSGQPSVSAMPSLSSPWKGHWSESSGRESLSSSGSQASPSPSPSLFAWSGLDR